MRGGCSIWSDCGSCVHRHNHNHDVVSTQALSTQHTMYCNHRPRRPWTDPPCARHRGEPQCCPSTAVHCNTRWGDDGSGAALRHQHSEHRQSYTGSIFTETDPVQLCHFRSSLSPPEAHPRPAAPLAAPTACRHREPRPRALSAATAPTPCPHAPSCRPSPAPGERHRPGCERHAPPHHCQPPSAVWPQRPPPLRRPASGAATHNDGWWSGKEPPLRA